MSQMKLNDSERIKVLWIDDESAEDIQNKFYDAGIDATIFTTTEKALNEYKTHRGTFQAIILDLQGEDGTTIEFSKALKEFEKFLKEDLIPLYVLTNYLQSDQPYKEARGVISAFGLKEDSIYHKGSQVPFLINDLKAIVLERDRFKIRKKYESAFEAFESDILNKDNQSTLYKMVGSFSGENIDYKGLFNEMRQMIEMIFYRFIELKRLPPDYLYGLGENGKPSFSNDDPRETRINVIKYLSGDFADVGMVGIKDKTTIQIENGRIISLHMRTVLDKLFNDCNNNSHYNPNKNWASTPLFQRETPHFFESTALLLIDFILWAKSMLNEENTRFKEKDRVKKIVPQDYIQNNESSTLTATSQASLINSRPLKHGEQRKIVRVSPSGKPRYPNVVCSEGPVFNKGNCIMGNLVSKLEENQNQQEVSAIVINAFQIIEFEV